jgi:ABC-2 type transport system permease protein
MIINPLFKKILLINPMAQSIQDARHILVTKEALTVSSTFGHSIYMAIPLLIVAGVLVWGVLYFKKESKDFAENI